MKKTCFILFIVFNCYTFSQSIPINLASTKNFKKAIVYFKDGTVKNGYADYNSISNHKVKFKETIDSKKKTYDSRKVKQLFFTKDSSSYYYRKIGNTRSFVLLKLVKKGNKISLFTSLNKESQSSPLNKNNGGITLNFYNRKPKFFETLFFGKNDDDKAHYFNGDTKSQKFKKSIQKHFSDCPRLIKEVTNNKFGQKEIAKVIDFYEINCKN